MRSLLSKGRKFLSIVVACVMLAATMTVSMSTETFAVNTSLTYKIYNASTGSYLSSYTLSSNPVQDNSRRLYDPDDRTIDFSKSGVVKIIQNNSTGYYGSGFVVDAHTIATAAHCVCKKPYKMAQTYAIRPDIKILLFNSNGNIALTITTPKQIHIPDQYALTGDYTNEYDYALITVEEDLSSFACFELGVITDTFVGCYKPISTTGFPKVVNHTTVNTGEIVSDNGIVMHNAYTGSGRVIYPEVRIDNNRQFCFNCDISGGNSGGPVYTTSTFNGNIYYTVIGIAVADLIYSNGATRITTDLLHFYKNNPNISY